MHAVDIFLLATLAFFVWNGYKDGLVLALLKIAILIFALFIAVLYVSELAETLGSILPFFSNESLTPVAFIIIFLGIIIVLGFFAKISKIINKLPIIGSLNQLLGAMTGLLKGVIVLSLIIFFMNYFIFGTPYKKYLVESRLYQSFEEFAPSIYDSVMGLLPTGKNFYDEFNVIVKEQIDKHIIDQDEDDTSQ